MRTSLRIPTLVLAWVLVLVGPCAAGAGDSGADDDEIFTCRDENGDVTFQDDPCPEPEKTKADPGAAAPAGIKSPAPAPPKRAPSVPKPKPAIPESEPRAVTVSTATTSWTVVPPAENSHPVRTRRLGAQSFPTRLDPAGPVKGPSFASPEQTWRSFLAAIEAGDRGAAAACLTPTALENLGSDLESFPVDEMRRMVGTFTRIENDGDLGLFWSIHGVREGERPKWLFFEEITGGQWKISGI